MAVWRRTKIENDREQIAHYSSSRPLTFIFRILFFLSLLARNPSLFFCASYHQVAVFLSTAVSHCCEQSTMRKANTKKIYTIIPAEVYSPLDKFLFYMKSYFIDNL